MIRDEIKKLVAAIIVKMLTNNAIAFSVVFIAVLVVGLLIYLIISLLGLVKEINIGPLFIASILMGLASVGIKFYIMRRFSRVGA